MSDELPCLDLLEATPAILRGLMTEVSDDDARWKPAPDRFSSAEVLAHLSHSEGHCYRARVDRFLTEAMPEFEAAFDLMAKYPRVHLDTTMVGVPFAEAMSQLPPDWAGHLEVSCSS